MRTFTFLTLAFNQEKYIIEHLESIKYQIENYGSEMEFSYILCDDASKDNTVEKVNQWLDKNDKLFTHVTILTGQNNIGTIANLKRGIELINTDAFKLLAGDDLFYKNNIFEQLEQADLVVTPLIGFTDDANIVMTSMDDFEKMLCIKGDVYEGIKKMFNYYRIFDAPGMLLSKEFIQEKELWELLSPFKYIEDMPMWHYALNLRNKKTSIKVLPKVMVLYRTSNGISTNKNHDFHRIFLEEHQKILDLVGFNYLRWPKIINPYVYIHRFKDMWFNKMTRKRNAKISEFSSYLISECENADEFVSYISKKADEYREDE